MQLKYLKIVSIIMFSFLYLQANEIPSYLFSNKNKCITDFYYKSSYIYYHYASSPNTLRSTSTKKDVIIDGYLYNDVNNTCYPKPILQNLHITQNTYSSLMAFVGILVGFVFLFFGIYIAVEVAKK